MLEWDSIQFGKDMRKNFSIQMDMNKGWKKIPLEN